MESSFRSPKTPDEVFRERTEIAKSLVHLIQIRMVEQPDDAVLLQKHAIASATILRKVPSSPKHSHPQKFSHISKSLPYPKNFPMSQKFSHPKNVPISQSLTCPTKTEKHPFFPNLPYFLKSFPIPKVSDVLQNSPSP